MYWVLGPGLLAPGPVGRGSLSWGPATSATVERLFSKVGIAYSAKRQSQSAGAGTLADILYTQVNVP